jgi:hypothetical protein
MVTEFDLSYATGAATASLNFHLQEPNNGVAEAGYGEQHNQQIHITQTRERSINPRTFPSGHRGDGDGHARRFVQHHLPAHRGAARSHRLRVALVNVW